MKDFRVMLGAKRKQKWNSIGRKLVNSAADSCNSSVLYGSTGEFIHRHSPTKLLSKILFWMLMRLADSYARWFGVKQRDFALVLLGMIECSKPFRY